MGFFIIGLVFSSKVILMIKNKLVLVIEWKVNFLMLN